MRVQTEEWRRFIPGIRMYKGKKTFFYNGEILWEGDDEDGRPLVYNMEERNTWQVIIILPGVEMIPEWTFYSCYNVKIVIMTDTVRRVESGGFYRCIRLDYVRLSQNLEYIGLWAFHRCESLTSIFIPPSCREIDCWAFQCCNCLLIVGMPQHVRLGEGVFFHTLLMKKSPIETDEDGEYNEDDDDEAAIEWIKSINNEDAYALHRVCSSFYNPLYEIVYSLVKQQGIKAMKMPNEIGVTPSQYLAANTFADISEKEIVNRYISEMMGEVF